MKIQSFKFKIKYIIVLGLFALNFNLFAETDNNDQEQKQNNHSSKETTKDRSKKTNDNNLKKQQSDHSKNFKNDQSSNKKLESLKQRWKKMSSVEKNKFRKIKKKWDSLDPKKKNHLKALFRKFKKLPIKKQKRITRNFKRFKKLPLKKQKEILAKYKKFKKNRSLSDSRNPESEHTFSGKPQHFQNLSQKSDRSNNLSNNGSNNGSKKNLHKKGKRTHAFLPQQKHKKQRINRSKFRSGHRFKKGTSHIGSSTQGKRKKLQRSQIPSRSHLRPTISSPSKKFQSTGIQNHRAPKGKHLRRGRQRK